MKDVVIKRLQGHNQYVSCVSFFPDDKRILTAGLDNTVKIWDLGGEETHSFEGHVAGVNSVAFTPDGKHFLTGSEDFTARLWEIETGEFQELPGHTRGITAIAVSPDGKQAVTGSGIATGDRTGGRILKIWDLSQREESHSFEVHADDILSTAISPDGKQILTGSRDRTAKLWDFEGNLVQEFKEQDVKVSSVAFSPDGTQVLIGNHEAQLWNLEEQRIQTIFEVKNIDNLATLATFSPDGKQVLTASQDDTIRLYDLEGKELLSLNTQSGITDLAFSPDGKYIAATDHRKHLIQLWDLHGNLAYTFSGHTALISSIAFSPDGKHLISGSLDKTVKLWHNPMHSWDPKIYRLNPTEREKYRIKEDFWEFLWT